MGKSRGLGLHLIFICVSLVTTTYTCLGDGNFSVFCPQKERLALLRFKESVKDVGGMLSSWVGNDCCQWERIHCHALTATVQSLHLRGDYYNYYYFGGERDSYLVGNEVKSSLAELRHLNYLDLSGNAFFGSRIPEFIGSFKQLSYLNLSHAGFQGIIPPHIGNLSSLKVLDLNYNEDLIADDMIRTLSLPSLEHLGLSWLNLSGWDVKLYIFPSLKELSLNYCGLSNVNLGSSLNSSRILPNINHLDLGFNSFKSPLPIFFRNMTSLEFLDLSNFNLSLSWNFANFLDMIPSILVLRLLECGLDNMFLSSPHLNFSTLSNIQYLGLSGNSIEGVFPSVLTNMSSLRVLRLSDNGLNSSVPAMPNLLELDLSYNRFKKIEHLGIWRQCHLKHLTASSNPFEIELTDSPKNVSKCSQYALERLHLHMSLNGTIPESLGRLANLRSLYLYGSSLTGTVPESLGRLRYLEALDLSSNRLTGTIPVSVWQLTNLRSLIISRNSLEGVVSETHFANLSMLKELYTSFNTKLTFNMSREWIPPFQLTFLLLSSCTIANGFPHWLRNQRKLVQLELSNATISGPLPTWLRKMPIIPVLDLSHNNLTGPLTNLPHRENLFGYGYGYIFLENNLFNESIPRSFCRMRDLRFLDLSRNKLTGKIPKCLGNMQSLVFMIFNSNQLSGVIPGELGTLEHLYVLDLGENRLSGYIPELIGEGLVSLRVLRLHKNNLTGRIPLSLCKTSKLQILDVAYNNLTGTIPPCLRELNAMSNTSLVHFSGYSYSDEMVIQVLLKGVDRGYSKNLDLVFNMDLSSNNLVGKIPVELTTLSMLVGLNLSNNHLSGIIPDNIGDLTNLESLDLSGNKLTGMIPQSMADLTFLSHLNLSRNNLVGQIPTGRQLQTLLDPSIYAGNRDLCGAPLPKNCSNQEDPTTTSNKKDEAGDELAKEWLFYVDIMSGFATGFWGVIGVLLFKKQWRQKLFMFAEETMDKIYVAVMVRVAKMKRGREVA